MHNQLIQKLCSAGFQAYIVGGAARDLLLGVEPEDIDIATSATPIQIAELFKDHNVVDVNGTSFRVVIVDGIEIAQFRKDIPFGLSAKNCETSPAENIIEDLSRRDLTCNSIALCPITGDIIDPFNGQKDLEKHIIKFTGNPNDRIWEDPCRILRACRFLAKLGPETFFDDMTLKAIINNINLVKTNVPPERIRLEILKAMKLQKPSIFFETLHMIGLLDFIMPNLSKCVSHCHGKYHPEDIFEHCMLVGDHLNTDDPILRLAGFIHDVGKPKCWDGQHFLDHEKVGSEIVQETLRNLKFSNDEIKRISNLILMHMRSTKKILPKTIRKYLRDFELLDIQIEDWLNLKIADRHGNTGKDDFTVDEIITLCIKIENELNPIEHSKVSNIKNLAITGFDIMKTLQIKSGPMVGNILKSLMELVIDDPKLNDYDSLISIIQTKNWE